MLFCLGILADDQGHLTSRHLPIKEEHRLKKLKLRIHRAIEECESKSADLQELIQNCKNQLAQGAPKGLGCQQTGSSLPLPVFHEHPNWQTMNSSAMEKLPPVLSSSSSTQEREFDAEINRLCYLGDSALAYFCKIVDQSYPTVAQTYFPRDRSTSAMNDWQQR